MFVPVSLHAVPRGDDVVDEAGVELKAVGADEEGGRHPVTLQDLEDQRGQLLEGAVVERQGDGSRCRIRLDGHRIRDVLGRGRKRSRQEGENHQAGEHPRASPGSGPV